MAHRLDQAVERVRYVEMMCSNPGVVKRARISGETDTPEASSFSPPRRHRARFTRDGVETKPQRAPS